VSDGQRGSLGLRHAKIHLAESPTSQSFGIAVQGRGTIYLAGHTPSTAFPTRRPVQAAFAGESDAFVLRLEMSARSPMLAPPRRVAWIHPRPTHGSRR
jgi:hypothetical protein